MGRMITGINCIFGALVSPIKCLMYNIKQFIPMIMRNS
jgi:hypothetical protein